MYSYVKYPEWPFPRDPGLLAEDISSLFLFLIVKTILQVDIVVGMENQGGGGRIQHSLLTVVFHEIYKSTQI